MTFKIIFLQEKRSYPDPELFESRIRIRIPNSLKSRIRIRIHNEKFNIHNTGYYYPVLSEPQEPFKVVLYYLGHKDLLRYLLSYLI
jgi:hypothetical protein